MNKMSQEVESKTDVNQCRHGKHQDDENVSAENVTETKISQTTNQENLENLSVSNTEEKELAEATGNVSVSRKDTNNASSAKIIFKLRDINKKIVHAWEQVFIDNQNQVQVSHGDIFKDAPAADALVSPANSFGFMDGGIDMVYINHFGWQMQTRLQKVIKEEYDGELLVGQAAIVPTFEEGTPENDMHFDGCNENLPIKYLISAPTMRVPLDVRNTTNAYLAFRAIILAVKKHNAKAKNESEKIKSVLCPGLGTAVGLMPAFRCAYQMCQAFTVYELGKQLNLVSPPDLYVVHNHHVSMTQM